jgi:hypothetical protein
MKLIKATEKGDGNEENGRSIRNHHHVVQFFVAGLQQGRGDEQ